MGLDPVLYTPDYSFLRYTLGKKDAQYEQGLKAVTNTYGSLKKDLSDPINVERRDNYLKTAETELQKIASSDLSLQQNVNAANAIFDPIVTDPAIVYDAYHTGRIKRELSTMESWQNSEDLATRKKFNPLIYNWVKKDLESLQNGNGDIANYKVQGRKAWAYIDSQDLINAAAKEMGYKVENDELGQPYIVTTNGGKTTRESAEMFGKSVLAANPLYQQQKWIMAQAQVENKIDQARNNPLMAALPKEEILKQYSDSEYVAGRARQKEYISGLSDRLSTQRAEFEAYKTSNADKIKANPEGPEAVRAIKMFNDLNNFKTQIDDIQKDYADQYGITDAEFAAKKDKFVKSFIENPEGYYANQLETEDVIRWSNMRTSFGTRSIKADQAYLGVLTAANRSLNTLNNIQDDQFDNQMDVEELKVKQAAAAAKLAGKTSTGERQKNADGSDKLSDIEFVDVSSTQINSTTKLNQLKDRLSMSKAAAIQNLTGTFGGLYLLERMGTKPEYVSLIRQYIGRKQMDDKATMSKEEQAAFKSAYTTMWAWAKQDETANADFLTNLREDFKNNKTFESTDFPGLLKVAAKSYKPTDEREAQAQRSLFEYDKNQAEIKRISAAVDKGTQVAINAVKDNKDFSGILVDDKTADGKPTKRLLEAKDIVAKIPSTVYQDVEWAIDPRVTLTEQDKQNIAQGYLAGTIKVEHVGKLRAGTDTIADIFKDDPGTYINYNGKRIYLANDFTTFPLTTSDYQNRLKRLNEKVPLPEFNTAVNTEGAYGSAVYELRNEPKEQIRTLLTIPTQTNSNILISSGGGLNDYSDVDPDTQAAVRNAMAKKDEVEDIKLFTTSPLNQGNQVVSVTFAPPKSDKDKSVVAGKTFYFPINVTAKSNDVFKIFADVDDMDEFMDYSKNNKPYLMDYHEGSGVKAVVMSDQPGGKTGTVRLYSKYDPTTRKYGDSWIEQPPIPFDLNKVSFSEMKNEIYNNFLFPYMQRKMSYDKQAQTAQTGSGNSLYNNLTLSW